MMNEYLYVCVEKDTYDESITVCVCVCVCVWCVCVCVCVWSKVLMMNQ